MSAPVHGPVRKLVILRPPADVEPIPNDIVNEIRRILDDYLGSGKDPASLIVGAGWTMQIVEGDEVLVRVEPELERDPQMVELKRRFNERYGVQGGGGG